MKHDSLNIKRTALLYFLAATVIYTVAFWISVLLLRFIQIILQDYLGLNLFTWLFDDMGWVILMYGLGLILCTVLFILYVADWVEKCYSGVSGLLQPRHKAVKFPRVLERFEYRLNDVARSIAFKERAAAEAEQRKNDLIMYLAHDLKTPLTSIIGYLSLLEESPELPVESRAKYTRITLDKAYRLELLIDEFFDITRFNLQTIVLDKNRIDLKLCLQQLAEEFFPAFEEKNIAFSLHCPENIMLIGDTDKLGRVFDNLMKNAVAYSYPDSQMSVTAERQQNNAVIRFRKQGDEIPPEKLERIFDKFFRLDSSRATKTGGAGLGLAIAKQIVELHGGTLSAHSQKEFTEFTVVLPL